MSKAISAPQLAEVLMAKNLMPFELIRDHGVSLQVAHKILAVASASFGPGGRGYAYAVKQFAKLLKIPAEEKYGYRVGEIVENVLELYDEGGIRVDYGTQLRLVAFPPKVCMIRKERRKTDEDQREYFYNAVRASQKSDHGQRIRANFCTIRKIKKGKA